VPEMPFADNRRFVASFLEALRHEPLGCVETVSSSAWDDGGLQTVTKWITPGHQRCARWRAHWLNVKLFELCARGRKFVDVRCLDVGATVESDIFPAKIIGHDVNDVRFVLRSVSAVE